MSTIVSPALPNYHKTVMACYRANIAQAAVVNLTPVLFIPIKDQLGLTYQHLGLLVLINFITQVACDIIFSKSVDRYGFRPFVVTANILCGVGFLLFAFAPWLFPRYVFAGLIAGTILFSASGGLFELLLSPIIDAIPTDEKGKAMAVLHSFYAWGQVAVVLLTTACLYLFGRTSWPFIVMAWSLLPFLNTISFAKVPLDKKHEDGAAIMGIRRLLKSPIFIIAFIAILFGGASEVTMAQWGSSFLERGIALPKLAGDILGMCGFALMLGIGRLVYGILGSKLNLHRVMIWGAAGAAVCYLVAVFSAIPALSVAACALCGICVSLLWPGTLVLASAKLPMAGASMFALLAAGGDMGASIGPWVTGFVTDTAQRLHAGSMFGLFSHLPIEQLALRIGLLAGLVMPVGALITHVVLRKVQPKES